MFNSYLNIYFSIFVTSFMTLYWLVNELQWVVLGAKKAFLRFCFGAVWLRFSWVSYRILAMKTYLI